MPRSVRTPLVGLLTALLALTVGLAPASHGYAAPSAADIERQIDSLWNTLEPLIEQYNGVHSRLKADQAKAAKLQAQMDPLQTQVTLAQTRVGALASHLYMVGPAAGLNAMLEAGSPSDFAAQIAALDQIAYSQQSTVAGAKALVDKYSGQKAPLDALIAKEKTEDADLAARKTQIEAQLAKLQKLRQQAYGSSGSTGVLRPAACPYEYIGGGAGTAAKFACSQIGKPYVWAADGPDSYDCSGLTMAAWRAAGRSLDHFTGAQWRETTHISRTDLRVGDLVFYFSDLHHVAIYVGGGWVVHAPHPGDYVRMAKMTVIGSIHGYGRVG